MVYDCCVYKLESEQDSYCLEDDDECIGDFRKALNYYYLALLILLVIALLYISVRCVISRRRENRLTKAKKAPMLEEDKERKIGSEVSLDPERADGQTHSNLQAMNTEEELHS